MKIERLCSIVFFTVLAANVAFVLYFTAHLGVSNDSKPAQIALMQKIPIPPPPPPTQQQFKYRRLSPFGRACNRIITLATGLERAKRENFILQLYPKEWQPIFVKMDMELFNRTFFGRYEFLYEKQKDRDRNDLSWLVAAPEYWCGLKVNLEPIRTGFRPQKRYQEAAAKKVEEMKQKHDMLVSVHLRHYDGLCEKLLPNACESTSTYEFMPKPFGCNQTLTKEYWDWINKDWPSVTPRNVGVYLSTDRQVKSIDDSYLLRPASELAEMGITKVYQPPTEDLHKTKVKNEYAQTSEMFEDMWISVLSDRHVGMPLSSCDKVVAEWRSVENKNEDAIHPRKCYSKYFYHAKVESDDDFKFCHHTRVIGLDTPEFNKKKDGYTPCEVCDHLLALYVAISKAKANGNMDLHLYGAFASFVQANFDRNNKHTGIYTEYLVNSKEEMLFDRMHVYDSGKFRASGVKANTQTKCARGKLLQHVWLPNQGMLQEPIQDVDVFACGKREANFCFAGNEQQQQQPERKESKATTANPQQVLKQLWRLAQLPELEADPSSPCSQVLALWRRKLGISTGMLPRTCFQGYFDNNYNNREEDPVVSRVLDNGYWECA